MAGSGFGTNFRITTWGETHGAGVGVVVDGCPAGLPLEREDVQKYLDRRKPGQSKYTTQRKEGDQVEILSGIFEGRTTGTPISMVVYNKDQRSKDYSNIKDIYRPGHADFTFDMKYGFRDYRGGGRSSGRETIGRVAAGAVAAKVLKELGIEIKAYAKAIAGIEVSKDHFDFAEMNNNPFNMPDKEAAKLVQEKADQMIKEMDSIGGIIECQITGMPVGIGETVFDKLFAELSKAIMSIGSVKGFEIGDGFEVANLLGSENNDDFICVDGKIEKETNHSGGVLGGMSDEAKKVMEDRKTPIASFYCNLTIFKDYYKNLWFPYTMPISDIYGLKAAMDNIAADKDLIKRHARIANATRKAIEAFGLKLHLESGFSDTVTVFDVPEGMTADDILERMREKHGIMLAGSFGELAGKVIRIGHMGASANVGDMLEVMSGLEETLRYLGWKSENSLLGVFHTEL